MDAPRRRLVSLLEWMCAALCAAGAAALLAIAVHSFRQVPAVVPVSAKEAPDPAPIAGIPPGVAQVPLLLLKNNREVRVGDRLGDIATRLGPTAQLVSESFEDLGKGVRTTRFYTDVDMQFILVFEAASRDKDPSLSAVFIR